jgi:hypothetical protein
MLISVDEVVVLLVSSCGRDFLRPVMGALGVSSNGSNAAPSTLASAALLGEL